MCRVLLYYFGGCGHGKYYYATSCSYSQRRLAREPGPHKCKAAREPLLINLSTSCLSCSLLQREREERRWKAFEKADREGSLGLMGTLVEEATNAGDANMEYYFQKLKTACEKVWGPATTRSEQMKKAAEGAVAKLDTTEEEEL